ncbi:hypothetical protein ACFFU8_09335 [Chromobacterium piscinae]|uniref:hypothetical protein n=1 Tax=Chromobacterium piscinae TaxID=686831 RepID=UPI001E5FF90E|nr:hypothetical protein [Chromobacterium piscinae]MCD5327893.1 hypothetical protein [Chromobacterium piscinae]
MEFAMRREKNRGSYAERVELSAIGSASAYAVALVIVFWLIYYSHQELDKSIQDYRIKRISSVESVIDMKDSKQRFISYAFNSCLDRKGTSVLECKNDTLNLATYAFGKDYKMTANFLLERMFSNLTITND